MPNDRRSCFTIGLYSTCNIPILSPVGRHISVFDRVFWKKIFRFTRTPFDFGSFNVDNNMYVYITVRPTSLNKNEIDVVERK